MHDALSPSLILVLMCCMLLSPLLQLESIQEQLDGLSAAEHSVDRTTCKRGVYILVYMQTL